MGFNISQQELRNELWTWMGNFVMTIIRQLMSIEFHEHENECGDIGGVEHVGIVVVYVQKCYHFYIDFVRFFRNHHFKPIDLICMYICMSVCVCICISINMYIYIYIYILLYVLAKMSDAI